MSGQRRYSLRRSLRDTLYGKVFLGLDNHTNQPIIIKQCGLWHVKKKVSKQGFPVKEDVYEEIRLHQELSADEALPVFVLKLLDVVQDDENLFIILEFARGGELFAYVQTRGRPDPRQEAERIARVRQQHELDLIAAKRLRQEQPAAVAATSSANDADAKTFEPQDASSSSTSSGPVGDAARSSSMAPSSSSSSAGALQPTSSTSSAEMKGDEPRAPDLRHPFEIEACRFMRQLLEGVRYIHSKYICHRDLSLENLLLDEHGNVKIIDFGVATGGPDSTYARGDWKTPEGRVGKVGYMAPEVWDGEQYDGRLADVWSIGVIFFIILVGCPPYELPQQRDPRFRLIISGRVDSLLDHWGLTPLFTRDAVDLLQRMFKPESQRITVDEMLEHRFFANQSAAPLTGPWPGAAQPRP